MARLIFRAPEIEKIKAAASSRSAAKLVGARIPGPLTDPKAAFADAARTGSSCPKADRHEGKKDWPSWVDSPSFDKFVADG
jgi:hypothetical protein